MQQKSRWLGGEWRCKSTTCHYYFHVLLVTGFFIICSMCNICAGEFLTICQHIVIRVFTAAAAAWAWYFFTMASHLPVCLLFWFCNHDCSHGCYLAAAQKKKCYRTKGEARENTTSRIMASSHRYHNERTPACCDDDDQAEKLGRRSHPL